MGYSLIVAMDNNQVIGNNNSLPWHLPADLNFVKDITEGGALIMGRKNFESIGRVLPNRKNVILTRDVNFSHEGCEIIHTVEDILSEYPPDEDIFIFGGSEIYKLFLPYVSTMLVTRIDHEFEGDTYFPDIPWDEWEEVSCRKGTVDDKNVYPHNFFIYERKVN